MKKKAVFFFLFLLVATGCQYLLNRPQTISGEGVRVEFVEFPERFLGETEPFLVKTRITNNNPTAPLSGNVCVNDFVTKRLGGIPENSCEPFTLEPAEEIEGKLFPKQAEQDFGPFSYERLNPGVPYSTNIAAIFSYLVESRHFVEGFCVKKSSSAKTPIPCDRSETITTTKQPRTPLQVTSIQKNVNSLGNDQANVRITLTLKKTDKGDLVSRENLEEPFSTNALVDLSVSYLGIPFQCAGLSGGRLDFSQDAKEVACHAVIDVSQEYIAEPLEVHMIYGFRKVIQTDSIKLIPEEEQSGDLLA